MCGIPNLGMFSVVRDCPAILVMRDRIFRRRFGHTQCATQLPGMGMHHVKRRARGLCIEIKRLIQQLIYRCAALFGFAGQPLV